MNDNGQDKHPPIPSSSEVSLGVRIDRICEAFENLLKAGKFPPIETYLSEVPDNHRGRLLEELLGLELDYRAKAGDSFTSEEYTLRFPEHASAVAELVVSVRRQKPDEPKPGETQYGPPPLDTADPAATIRRSLSPAEPARIGQYEIIETCGRGGMGVVYKAWHELFKQYRAIKVLPSDFDEDDIHRFSMEIELAGRLNHPNIVQAHDADRDQGRLYLVMEFVDGINLDHLINHHQRLPLGLACELIRQAAEGLQHAHEHFLVHRDIKPSNLMIDQSGQVKILDFGLARLQAEANNSRLTKRGSVMGTIDFMAPEQWEDPMGATIQSDIYSLGCTLYYLITGTPPYGGESYTHWLKKQEAHRLGPVPRVEHEHGEKVQPIIDRMMAKSLAERFASPHEIVEALGPLSDNSEIKRYAETPAPKVKESATAISRTPVPTVNVSSPDLLARGHSERLREEFAPADRDVGADEKTRRPHESSTDIDSDSQAPRPPRPAWFKSRKGQASLAVLAVVLLSATWLLFRPARNPEFAVQMGALPGLNGDWWFEETPWFGPGFRKVLMLAIRNGETEIAGVSLEDLPARLRAADTQSVHKDLEAIARELEPLLPDHERFYAGQVLILDRTHSSYDQDLLNILPAFGDEAAKLDDEALLAQWSPTELHLFAGILHHLSANNSEYALLTEQFYKAAIDSYHESDPVEKVLRALARSDFSRFLGDRREYSQSILRAQEAAADIPDAMLFQVSVHCQMADQYRKLENLKRAFEQLKGGEDTAEAWAKRANLAADHPLRAEMLERRAWLRVDGWHMQQAIDAFETATQIREANQNQGNAFAWRPMLFNKQGQAMALHFQGRGGTDPADEPPTALTIYEDLIQTILHGGGRLHGEGAEARDRLPNICERKADVYLFGDPPDYEQAQKALGQAAAEAETLNFRNSATLWFYLARLYYKKSLALALAGPEYATLPESHSNSPKHWLARAKALEADFEKKMAAAPETFHKQQKVFEIEKKAALALISRKADNSYDAQAWEELRKVIDNVQPEQVNRTNIEVLLLVIKAVFDSGTLKDETELVILADQLLLFTEGPRNGNPQIRLHYLKPVFQSAIKAIEEAADGPLSGELEHTRNDLQAVIAPL